MMTFTNSLLQKRWQHVDFTRMQKAKLHNNGLEFQHNEKNNVLSSVSSSKDINLPF